MDPIAASAPSTTELPPWAQRAARQRAALALLLAMSFLLSGVPPAARPWLAAALYLGYPVLAWRLAQELGLAAPRWAAAALLPVVQLVVAVLLLRRAQRAFASAGLALRWRDGLR